MRAVEVDRVRHGSPRVHQRDPHEVADLDAQDRSRHLVPEGPDQLLVALGDGHLALGHDQLDLVDLAAGELRRGGIAEDVLGCLGVGLDRSGSARASSAMVHLAVVDRCDDARPEHGAVDEQRRHHDQADEGGQAPARQAGVPEGSLHRSSPRAR
jgi:hypothetical protein